MGLEFRDPATGKIKPAFLIGGIGIGGAALFLLLGRGGGSSGVTSGGQSGDNTDALSQLQDAINNLAGNGGGGGGSGTPGTTGNGGGTASGGAGFGDSVGAPIPENQFTPTYGDSNVSPSVGEVPQSPYQGGIGDAVSQVNTYPAAANTPQALSKPSNSGLSSVPTYTQPTYAPADKVAAQIAVGKGATITDSGPTGSKNPGSAVGKAIAKAVTAIKVSKVVTAKQTAVGKGKTVSDSGSGASYGGTSGGGSYASTPKLIGKPIPKKKQPVSTGGKKNPSATI